MLAGMRAQSRWTQDLYGSPQYGRNVNVQCRIGTTPPTLRLSMKASRSSSSIRTQPGICTLRSNPCLTHL